MLTILLSMAMMVSLAHAQETTHSPISSVPTVTHQSVGTAELQKEITAQKIRIGQLAQEGVPPSGIARTLHRGSSGTDVQLLQDFLKLYGTFPATTLSTGFFGSRTLHAVKEFQHKESIDSIGVVGPKTRAHIRALSAHELIQEKTRVVPSGETTTPQIMNIIFSSDVGEDGSGVDSNTVFARNTPNIYAILTLSNARQDTAIGFIRYYNGIYIDSAVTHPSRSGLRYLHVQWSLKATSSRVAGTYTTVWYVNGKKSKTATFIIN